MTFCLGGSNGKTTVIDYKMGYEDVHFKAGFRPLGTLDRQDKAWLMVKHQVVGVAWSAVVHTETL